MFKHVNHAVIDGDTIKFASGTDQFVIDRESIELIGEYTNEDGPFACDHFLLVTTATGMAYETCIDAIDDSFFADLQTVLGKVVIPKLAGHTTFESRVLWPDNLCGMAFLDFKNIPMFWTRAALIPLSKLHEQATADGNRR